ncbi:MAG: hypothetical protein OEV49_11530 [candidate division Zixibacteria bacterium]|nr:hypothetical protein [candidate division Zixibacteria bacterium]MDH3938559.1 hypothetical protein [candidate division Zixibacteria bacterium]MDH4033027.1 hypothetical protein [candidate division Zixibacteria bacterium]
MPASGQTLHTNHTQITFAGPHHAPTTSKTGSQEGGLPISPVADLENMPDLLSDNAVNKPVMTFFPEHFCFSNPQAERIGWPVCNNSCDSVLLHCTEWAWEACLDWETVCDPSFDSLLVQCDTTLIDTGSVIAKGGTLSVISTLVGDIDGSGSLPKDIADLVYMVEWIFDGDPTPRCPLTTDRNGDGLVGTADLVCGVDTMLPPD